MDRAPPCKGRSTSSQQGSPGPVSQAGELLSHVPSPKTYHPIRKLQPQNRNFRISPATSTSVPLTRFAPSFRVLGTLRYRVRAPPTTLYQKQPSAYSIPLSVPARHQRQMRRTDKTKTAKTNPAARKGQLTNEAELLEQPPQPPVPPVGCRRGPAW